MTERPKIPEPELIIHGPRISEKEHLCKVVDSEGRAHDGVMTPVSMETLAKLPSHAMLMHAEHIANSPISIVTEASKIDLSGGKPALVNSRAYLDSWERTFGRKQLDS